MENFKWIAVFLIFIVVLLLIFQNPLLESYYDFNSIEIEVEYKTDLLLNCIDIESKGESEYVQYENISGTTLVKLPHKSNIITINRETTKTRVYKLQTCFKRDNDYCFIFSCMPKHFSYNDKTHRGDMLVVIDNDGNIKYCYKSENKEWILDYNSDVALIYSSKENSFYCIDINSGEVQKKVQIEWDRYEKVVLSCSDYDNPVWQASLYADGDLIYKKVAPTID